MQQVDLNLLHLALILLEERSVTGAAKRLHLSQSAVSKQLAKLRQQLAPQLDDPLFVRHGQGLRPTPKALALEAPLRQWLRLSQTMLQPQQFDPQSDHCSFTVSMAEAAFHTLMPLLPKLAQQAPNMRLKVLPQSPKQFERMEQGQMDLLIVLRDTDERAQYPWHITHLPKQFSKQQLYMDSHKVLLRKNHPLLQQPWNIDTFLQATHITIWVEGSERWLMDHALITLGVERTTGAQVPDFHSAALMAQNSDMIFVCASHFADHLMPRFDLTELPLPFALGPISANLIWPPNLDNDPAHQYLREFICRETAHL